MRRVIIPLIFGFAGAAVLVSLGIWQMQRLAWKQDVLAEIETRIAEEPQDLPAEIDPETHKYLPVAITGFVAQNPIRVLVSRKKIGPGYRLITRLNTADRRVLVDLGFIKVNQAVQILPNGPLTITGNLHWPDDRNSSTPENDIEGNVWFARDIDHMADLLETEPVLIVARDLSFTNPSVTPLPVDTRSIPNDHLQYAITWFSLAFVWLAMTGFFLWRTRQPAKG